MVSKILIKLIDETIVPVILLITTRVISVILVCNKLEVPYDLTVQGFTFANSSDYLLVNSLSLAIILGVLSLGIGYILLKAFVFHDSHITPWLTARVFSYKLYSIIQNSYDIYTQGAVWLSYLYLVTITSGIMALFNLASSWVFLLGIGVSSLLTAIFVTDIEREAKIEKISGKIFDMDEKFLDIEERNIRNA